MKRKVHVLSLAVISLVLLALPLAAQGERQADVVIYVVNQDLYFDSIVGPDLPNHGPFQELYQCAAGLPPAMLCTDYGPGDPGYVGGRWWMDLNDNDEMDDADAYFSCPLLPPGREMQ